MYLRNRKRFYCEKYRLKKEKIYDEEESGTRLIDVNKWIMLVGYTSSINNRNKVYPFVCGSSTQRSPLFNSV